MLTILNQDFQKSTLVLLLNTLHKNLDLFDRIFLQFQRFKKIFSSKLHS